MSKIIIHDNGSLVNGLSLFFVCLVEVNRYKQNAIEICFNIANDNSLGVYDTAESKHFLIHTESD